MSDRTQLPTLTWFCVWQGPTAVTPARQDLDRVRTLLKAAPGLLDALLMVPAESVDPHYPSPAGSPSMVLQLYPHSLDSLERLLEPNSPLAPLASPEFLPSLAGHTAGHEGMLVRRYPVPEPGPANGLSYWVEYQGPAEDPDAWHLHYNTQHPVLLAKLPGIRGIEIYTPADIVCGLDIPRRRCMQRNKTTFDSVQAMRIAMQSPVRAALRQDFHSLPAFQGTAHHFPFQTLPCCS